MKGALALPLKVFQSRFSIITIQTVWISPTLGRLTRR
jgi:hypothetical protein